MHFEILIEDLSGKKLLDIILADIIKEPNSFKVHPYGGIGSIPKNLTTAREIHNQSLLSDLPRILKGLGKTFNGYGDYEAIVILVCDLDNRCLKDFKTNLENFIKKIVPCPKTKICFAIEEGEAWLLGDLPAIKSAYPKAKHSILHGYSNDAVCGTWELLKSAIDPTSKTPRKTEWSEKIAPHMNIENNKSPSFRYFIDTLSHLIN